MENVIREEAKTLLSKHKQTYRHNGKITLRRRLFKSLETYQLIYIFTITRAIVRIF